MNSSGSFIILLDFVFREIFFDISVDIANLRFSIPLILNFDFIRSSRSKNEFFRIKPRLNVLKSTVPLKIKNLIKVLINSSYISDDLNHYQYGGNRWTIRAFVKKI